MGEEAQADETGSLACAASIAAEEAISNQQGRGVPQASPKVKAPNTTGDKQCVGGVNYALSFGSHPSKPRGAGTATMVGPHVLSMAYTSDLIYPIHVQANSFQQKFLPTLQLWFYRELPKDP